MAQTMAQTWTWNGSALSAAAVAAASPECVIEASYLRPTHDSGIRSMSSGGHESDMSRIAT